MNRARKVVLVVAWLLLVLAILFRPSSAGGNFGFVPIWDGRYAIDAATLYAEIGLIILGAIVFFVVLGDSKE